MKLTAELSLYPLQDDYIPVIKAFIDAARQHGDMVVTTNAMSTQICGEYAAVFQLVQEELAASYQRYGKQVLICKFIPWELDIR